MKSRALIIALLLQVACALASAQETHRHTGEHTHEEHVHLLHFTHPLIAESVSPDTKVRIDYAHRRHTRETDWELEAEYAFTSRFSIEAGAEYERESERFSHIHITPKLATFRWAEQMWLLGAGVTVGAPLGEESAYDLEPFVNAGLKRGSLELAAWAKLTHTFARDDIPEADEVGYNLVALLHASPRVQPLVELHGAEDEAALTPSLRFVPVLGSGLAIGAGVSIPITGEDTSASVAISAFYHF